MKKFVFHVTKIDFTDIYYTTIGFNKINKYEFMSVSSAVC